MWPVRRPPDCRSKVVHQGASWCTGEEKESDDDQGSCRRSKRLSVSQDIVSGPLLFSGVLTGPQVHTDWLQLRSIPCWTISAPSSSSLGDTRIPISLSTNSSSRKVTIAVHKETATIASACTPKNLQGPPLKIPKSSENVYSTVSFSANRATAKSPQTEAKRWMGTEPTGSSIWSRSRRAHPEHAKKAPTAPITIPSQGRARVQIAENWDYIHIIYKFRTIKLPPCQTRITAFSPSVDVMSLPDNCRFREKDLLPWPLIIWPDLTWPDHWLSFENKLLGIAVSFFFQTGRFLFLSHRPPFSSTGININHRYANHAIREKTNVYVKKEKLPLDFKKKLKEIHVIEVLS